MTTPVLHFGERLLSIDDVLALARGDAWPEIDPAPVVRERIRATSEALASRLAQGDVIYGVTTGFGDSCETAVPSTCRASSPATWSASTAAGTGAPLGGGVGRGDRGATRVPGPRPLRRARLLLLEQLCGLLEPPDPAGHPGRGLGGRQRRSDARSPTWRRCWWASGRCASRVSVMPAAEALRAAGSRR